MKIRYQDLNNPDFFEALRILDKSPLPIKETLKFNIIQKLCRQELATAQETYKKLVDKHAKMTTEAQGDKIVQVPMTGPNGEIVFKDETAFKKELETFLAHPVDVNCEPINLHALEGMCLSPAQIRALTPIIKEDEECPRSIPLAAGSPKRRR